MGRLLFRVGPFPVLAPSNGQEIFSPIFLPKHRFVEAERHRSARCWGVAVTLSFRSKQQST